MRCHRPCPQGVHGPDPGKNHSTLVLWVLVEVSPGEDGSSDALFEFIENR